MRRSLNLIKDNIETNLINAESESIIESKINFNDSALHTLGVTVRNNLMTKRFI